VGKKVAELCAEKQISKVCFDRGGFTYHGRIQVRATRGRGQAAVHLPQTC
jgi:ribosomal protein L18